MKVCGVEKKQQQKTSCGYPNHLGYKLNFIWGTMGYHIPQDRTPWLRSQQPKQILSHLTIDKKKEEGQEFKTKMVSKI